MKNHKIELRKPNRMDGGGGGALEEADEGDGREQHRCFGRQHLQNFGLGL